ncbi:MAG: hypothetical protein AVDCRST_MAG08-3096 [uncultured Acetobacteraceae bacterium]|uniref:Uncharacterized protein n=1 Tax=uncultured Acetobacteraceae bacterium TaxID=169975 RepID=A0A6J4J4A9_9PROT|nr:MAG: hypothetical protein AVDCRST_MAG08-3096 [uncultured Acetobacteraceae bacterium]
MIDNPEATERLLARLQAALPVPARLTPELVAAVREQKPEIGIRPVCKVVGISHAGDEGGIVCRFDFGSETGSSAFVSITHLRFDPRLPPGREIAAYQKHRFKRLRREPS